MSYEINYESQLGFELPNSEPELFFLEKYPLLDVIVGIKTIGDIHILRELLHLLINESIPEDETVLIAAFARNDWQAIEEIAHKMKGGALYCGTVRMQFACQFLERYRKAGHTYFLEKLYYQLVKVLTDTRIHVNEWLMNNHLPK